MGILGIDLVLPLAREPPTARYLDRLPLTANDVDGMLSAMILLLVLRGGSAVESRGARWPSDRCGRE